MNEKYSTELSHFESLAAMTPKKTPYAILVGSALIPVILVLINWLAPTEAVDDLKNAQEAQASDVAGNVQAAGDVDDI